MEASTLSLQGRWPLGSQSCEEAIVSSWASDSLLESYSLSPVHIKLWQLIISSSNPVSLCN